VIALAEQKLPFFELFQRVHNLNPLSLGALTYARLRLVPVLFEHGVELCLFGFCQAVLHRLACLPSAGKENEKTARKENKEGAGPEQKGFRLEWRLQQYKIAIAVDEKRADLIVAIAGSKPLANQQPQIARKIGIGFVNRFI